MLGPGALAVRCLARPGVGYRRRSSVDEVESDVFLADCPARTTLDLVANTWSVVVIFVLRDGPQRYGQLHGRIGGVSRKVLTETLRRLEANGLVCRRRLSSAPPGVEYSLTGLGHSLVEPVTVLSRWAEKYAEDVAAARESAG
jgi:DNA-binding HxlR family transcriptional regulator